jgi:SAM-dependent methyltransferase
MTPDQLRDEVYRWVDDVQQPSIESGEFAAYQQSIMPRTVFLKNLPLYSSVIDLGAGDGGLSTLKSWPVPARADLKLYAVSLEKGSYFDQYDGYALGNFDLELPQLDGAPFDALLCCNFLEHIKDPERCVAWMSSALKPGGRLFLEWPHEAWKQMPSMTELQERGYGAYTTNFWDDTTHVDAWPMERILDAMSMSKLSIESTGRLYFPWLGDELRNQGFRYDDMAQRTYGVWLRFGLGQFVVASKR